MIQRRRGDKLAGVDRGGGSQRLGGIINDAEVLELDGTRGKEGDLEQGGTSGDEGDRILNGSRKFHPSIEFCMINMNVSTSKVFIRPKIT